MFNDVFNVSALIILKHYVCHLFRIEIEVFYREIKERNGTFNIVYYLVTRAMFSSVIQHAMLPEFGGKWATEVSRH